MFEIIFDIRPWTSISLIRDAQDCRNIRYIVRAQNEVSLAGQDQKTETIGYTHLVTGREKFPDVVRPMIFGLSVVRPKSDNANKLEVSTWSFGEGVPY